MAGRASCDWTGCAAGHTENAQSFFPYFFPPRAFTHRRVMFFPCKCLRLPSISIHFFQAKKQAREAEAARREEDNGGVLDRSFDLV